MTQNNTTTTTTVKPGLPLFGYPGYAFDTLHILALICVVISLFATFFVLAFMSKKNGVKNFWKWLPGDRMVVYLAVCDLGLGVNHGLDHLITFVTEDHPVEMLCSYFGFMLQLFQAAQSIVVCFAAFNASLLLVKHKKLDFGKYDHRLLLCCFGAPFAAGVVLVALDYLGPTGAWCYADMRRPEGPVIHTIYAVILLVVFMLVSVCYALVWLTIKRSAQNLAKFNDAQKKKAHNRTAYMAKSLSILVAAFLVQWFPYVVYTVWSFIAAPTFGLLMTVVTFCNLGGIFNAVAYTLMKVLFQRKIREASDKDDAPATQTSTVKPNSVSPSG